MPTYRSASGSSAEDLFIELFSDTFGAEKAGYLYSQYPFSDIYQNSRFADFLIENGGRKVAIEIDDEASHNPKLVSQDKFYDDLLKQNSMIYLGWDVYRWAVRQMQQQPETVKDELRVFLGQYPSFKEIEDYLPTQRGKSLDGSKLELKEHQKQALRRGLLIGRLGQSGDLLPGRLDHVGHGSISFSIHLSVCRAAGRRAG